MSRQIDLTKKLSDDERAYLEARGMQASMDQNAMHLMGGGVDGKSADTADQESAEEQQPKGRRKTAKD